MIECGSLEYAHARLQARHGQRAGELTWQQLETTREFAAFLDVARGSALRPWVSGVTAQSTSTQIETMLRGHWRSVVAEVMTWMPAAWQAAVHWCAAWPELPALQHLARGGEPPAWMLEDAQWRELCVALPGDRAAVLAAGAWGPLACAWSAPASLAAAWRAEWERRLPQPLRDADDSLRQVVATLQRHGTKFAAAPPGPGALLRRALQARLSLLMRRATLEPAAAFIHLALSALELERLRGELLRRALFPKARAA